MKRKNTFGKSITFLIVGVLLVLAFIRGDKQIWFLGGVIAVWGFWTLAAVLKISRRSIKETLDKRRLTKSEKRVNRKANDMDNENSNNAPLLRHVNCRISEYLKSVYPTVTWEWCSENPEKLAVKGGTGRIRLYGITDFNYADVTFDDLAQIDCEMIRIIPFADLRKNGEPEPDKKNNNPVDPEAWYGIQGRKVLEKCVADLNSHGHDSLFIKENGDVCFLREDNEVIHDKFKNFPNKNSWKSLVDVIKKQGLSASALDNCIKVSW